MRYTYNVLPQYVVFSDRHLSSEDRLVERVSFSLIDSPLFNDHDAFGTSYFNDPDLVRRVVRSDGRSDSPEIGESNWVSYYNGKRRNIQFKYFLWSDISSPLFIVWLESIRR